MQNTSKKESDQTSVHSSAPYVVSCQSWWNSTGSQVLQPSLSKGLSLNMDSPRQPCHGANQFGLQLQDRDSSSTQSTGQSHHKVVAVGGGNPNGQCVSAQSGYDETYGRQVEGHMQSVVSRGAQDFTFPLSQVAYNQSMACIQYPYTDPYSGGFWAAYGPQTSIHPQMVGMAPARVPLPLSLPEDEPIFVNAKQYRGILRRRQCRAKLEAQNKVVKARKPYLHESRHLHALRRARGSGGRFLDAKKLPQSKPTFTTDSQNASDLALLQKGGNISESEVTQSENGNVGASCSDVTSVSNSDDMFHQVSGYSLHMGGDMQGGGGHMHNGSNHRVPVIH